MEHDLQVTDWYLYYGMLDEDFWETKQTKIDYEHKEITRGI